MSTRQCDKRSVLIREESVADRPAVREVVAAAFGSTAEADLVERIRESPQYVPDLSLVAVIESQVVGHVMISHAVLRGDDGERRVAMLAPLAVAPAFQKQGVGSALVAAAISRADDLGEPLVVLQGNPRFYSRFGFEFSVPHGISMHLPDWAVKEAAQVKLLSGYDPSDSSLRGLLIEPPTFDGLD